jgi:hypothetical protein
VAINEQKTRTKENKEDFKTSDFPLNFEELIVFKYLNSHPLPQLYFPILL